MTRNDTDDDPSHGARDYWHERSRRRALQEMETLIHVLQQALVELHGDDLNYLKEHWVESFKLIGESSWCDRETWFRFGQYEDQP